MNKKAVENNFKEKRLLYATYVQINTIETLIVRLPRKSSKLLDIIHKIS